MLPRCFFFKDGFYSFRGIKDIKEDEISGNLNAKHYIGALFSPPFMKQKHVFLLQQDRFEE